MSVTKKHRRSSGVANIGRDWSDGRHPKAVEMPPVSWGQCRIYSCGVVGDLAAELCQDHWDRGFDKRDDKRDKDSVPGVE